MVLVRHPGQVRQRIKEAPPPEENNHITAEQVTVPAWAPAPAMAPALSVVPAMVPVVGRWDRGDSHRRNLPAGNRR